MDVFDLFSEVDYTFLKVSRGGVYGNVIQETFDAVGVADIDEGMISSNNQESYQSSSLLYVHPDEGYMSSITVDGKVNLVGNGVRIDGKDYQISGMGIGKNQDDGTIEHYELTLDNTDYSDYSES